MAKKSKYESHVAPFLDRIRRWVESGASQVEVAKKLNLAPSTLKLYLAKGEKGEAPYSDLSDCFRTAVEVPDDNVEAAMYRRACGIEWEEKTYERKWDAIAGCFVEVCTKRVTKFTPPDPTSGMFWLTNRRPDRWRYKPEPTQGDEGGGTGVVELPPVMKAPAPPGEVSEDG